LESFFISVSKNDAVLIFQNVDEARTKDLIEILPYFPFMERIEYHNLNKHGCEGLPDGINWGLERPESKRA